MIKIDREKLGDVLVHAGYLTADQLAQALALKQENPELKLGDIVVSQGFIAEDHLLDALRSYQDSLATQIRCFLSESPNLGLQAGGDLLEPVGQADLAHQAACSNDF